MIVWLILIALAVVGWLVALLTLGGEWAALAWMLGLLAYLAAPLVVGWFTPPLKIGRRYHNLGFRFIGRCLLVCRKHGGYAIIASRFDPDYGKETGVVNGRRGYWEDRYGAMSRLATADFGMVTDNLGMVFDMRMAEIGQRFDAMVGSGEHERVKQYVSETRHIECDGELRQVTVKQGGAEVDAFECTTCDRVVRGDEVSIEYESERQFAKHLNLFKDMVPVDGRRIIHLIPGKADPFSAETGEEYGKFSLELYGRQFSGRQMITFLMFYGAGAGVMWFASDNGGGGGGAPIGNESDGGGILPIMLDAVVQLPGVVG